MDVRIRDGKRAFESSERSRTSSLAAHSEVKKGFLLFFQPRAHQTSKKHNDGVVLKVSPKPRERSPSLTSLGASILKMVRRKGGNSAGRATGSLSA